MEITILKDIIEFYTYRRARVEAAISISISERQWFMLDEYLKEQGKHIDNHICWKTSDGTCFMYSDRQLTIGTSINVKSW